jgi:type II secretory ATPase GspE/PulE/Tfp pilus assembly ATPase PilB-like protein
MSNDQIAGYLGMAAIYELLGVKAKCQEYAKRGLSELQKTRQSAAGQALRDSAVFPLLDQAERQLRGYLE